MTQSQHFAPSLRVLVAVALLTAVACSAERATGARFEAPSGITTALQAGTAESTPVQPTAQRFTVGVSASGTFKPGAALSIEVKTLALVSTDAAIIELTMPQLRDAEEKGRTRNSRVRSYRPHAVWRTSLQQGALDTRVLEVVFPRPGVYSIIATARRPGLATHVGNMLVVDFASAYVEVLVSSEGGRSSYAFTQRERKPYEGRGGQTEYVSAQDCTELDPPPECEQPPPPPPPPPPGTTTTFRFMYHDLYSHTDKPVRRAKVSYYINETGQTKSVTTDENGYWAIDCMTIGAVTLSLDGTDVKMTGHEASRTGWQFGYSDCFPQVFTISNWMTGWVWDNLLVTVDSSRAIFGRSRGRVEAEYTPSTSGSSYSPSNDRIKIGTNANWTEFGIFTVAHEYGHALQEGAMPWGIPNYSCSVHYLHLPSSTGCAWGEGWADYFGWVARRAATPSWVSVAEYNSYFSQCAGAPGSNADRCEASVASYLWDLTDPGNDGEGLALAYSYVFDNVAHCRLNISEYTYGEWPGNQNPTSSFTYTTDINEVVFARKCLRRELGAYYPPPFRVVVNSITNPTATLSAANSTSANTLFAKNIYGQ